MGEQIKLARLRRNLSAELVAERAGISRASLWKVEKGSPAVAMGIYAAVLHALNNLASLICSPMTASISSVPGNILYAAFFIFIHHPYCYCVYYYKHHNVLSQ